ncbi:MAG: hypothetical protein ACYCOU_03810 [Sulfobacillus sp.]
MILKAGSYSFSRLFPHQPKKSPEELAIERLEKKIQSQQETIDKLLFSVTESQKSGTEEDCQISVSR